MDSITINVFRDGPYYAARGTATYGATIIQVRGVGRTHADAMRDALAYAEAHTPK